jgi:hypothetical protein
LTVVAEGIEGRTRFTFRTVDPPLRETVAVVVGEPTGKVPVIASEVTAAHVTPYGSLGSLQLAPGSEVTAALPLLRAARGEAVGVLVATQDESVVAVDGGPVAGAEIAAGQTVASFTLRAGEEGGRTRLVIQTPDGTETILVVIGDAEEGWFGLSPLVGVDVFP